MKVTRCPDCGKLIALIFPLHDCKPKDEAMNKKRVLICDKCGAENWNLASEGKSHDQPANPIKGYEACAGVWRLPDRAGDRQPDGVVIQFPLKRTEGTR